MKIEAFLRESPLISVIQAARGFELRLNDVLSEHQLNLSAALVLVSVLLEEPTKVSPSELASALSMTRGNISHAVAGLEANGLLARRLDPEDARAHHLSLKPNGKKVAMQVVRVLHRLQMSFEKRVGTAQIKSFISVLKELEQECGEAGK
jgi:DNA-binding MarR family transcriptional regulator